ncbi:deaminase [Actinokineospora auranticolor]|uniref:Diaminohydroxyphosphoribosylaminopyrimidine deaminase/5-amino-6-(5-phosphoribosylamino)uracil reductase n=1 Tax=Actinokineospora auranticolor TaxID=155976 RepID=A0A2S6H0I2_9PSEU|nr:deaminase [Actinokineospora auranticolor]PPK70910.1 diaminohydroxyphosphoribosylaminopyrimidine deaminase/5-amino-6-(5-phosphoribosylamino)uracil reductase [Actinokineospora auranticolor]
MNQDERWMREAIRLAHHCPPADGAFSVGAVLVGADGTPLATGYSRETDPVVHAEESALAKPVPRDLSGATLYSTLEPCSERKSRPRTCTRIILDAGIGRVVIAWREPTLFVDGEGYELLTAAGIEVVELPDLADLAREPNRHLLDGA